MFLPFLVIQRKKTSSHSTAVMFHLSNGLEMRMKLSSEIYTGFSIMNMEIMVWYGNYAGLAQREHYIHVKRHNEHIIKDKKHFFKHLQIFDICH